MPRDVVVGLVSKHQLQRVPRRYEPLDCQSQSISNSNAQSQSTSLVINHNRLHIQVLKINKISKTIDWHHAWYSPFLTTCHTPLSPPPSYTPPSITHTITTPDPSPTTPPHLIHPLPHHPTTPHPPNPSPSTTTPDLTPFSTACILPLFAADCAHSSR